MSGLPPCLLWVSLLFEVPRPLRVEDHIIKVRPDGVPTEPSDVEFELLNTGGSLPGGSCMGIGGYEA